jgi:hypothetical protein
VGDDCLIVGFRSSLFGSSDVAWATSEFFSGSQIGITENMFIC